MMFLIFLASIVQSFIHEENSNISYINRLNMQNFTKKKHLGRKITSTNGECGDEVTYSIESTTLTITGRGKMYNYGALDAPWYQERSIKTINIG